ncbi:hypothetical protein N9355_04535 [Crocinitomicaceae bacterium]|nr:hypothetical protein [Crocinitomicaceae bacterium]
MKSLLKIALVLVVLLVVDQAFGQGCSQCKMLSEQGSGNGGMDDASFGSNINMGILYLMAIPYVLLILFFRKKIISGFRNLMGVDKKGS